jgi:predicted type IV restriction endonuclease
MSVTVPISKPMLALADVGERLSLQVNPDREFFPEWRQDLPALTTEEQQTIDRLQARFAAHRYRGLVAEGAVDKLLLSPLLDLVGFYEPEFDIRSEETIEFEVVDRDEVLRGRMDTLIIKDGFWVLVLEAKRTAMVALAVPQALAYMMASPHHDRPVYGLVSNGEEFIFLKVLATPTPQYSTSKLYATFFPPDSQALSEVVRVLKQIKAIALTALPE